MILPKKAIQAGLLGLWFVLVSVGAQAVESTQKGSDAEKVPADLAETQASPPFTPKENIYLKVNVPATRLELYVDGKLSKTYQVAVGMPKYPTPISDHSINYIVWNPWWIPPDSEWAKDAEKTPPGPGNPLGPVKMMMEDGLRIHGTNAPGSIGRAASHACMRMKSAEARELAWEIQQRYSEKNDPELLETYKRNNRSSYWVKLGLEVPVYIEYKLVETVGDKFLIHPDRYGRGTLQNELEAALGANSGIVVDKAFLKELAKKRGKGSLEITLQELKELQNPSAELTTPNSSAPLNPPAQASLSTQSSESKAKHISRPAPAVPPPGIILAPK